MNVYGMSGVQLREFLALPRVQPPVFFYCPCGKLHTNSLIGALTVCPRCGRRLHAVLRQVMNMGCR